MRGSIPAAVLALVLTGCIDQELFSHYGDASLSRSGAPKRFTPTAGSGRVFELYLAEGSILPHGARETYAHWELDASLSTLKPGDEIRFPSPGARCQYWTLFPPSSIFAHRCTGSLAVHSISETGVDATVTMEATYRRSEDEDAETWRFTGRERFLTKRIP